MEDNRMEIALRESRRTWHLLDLGASLDAMIDCGLYSPYIILIKTIETNIELASKDPTN